LELIDVVISDSLPIADFVQLWLAFSPANRASSLAVAWLACLPPIRF